jgi:hypothetical protein
VNQESAAIEQLTIVAGLATETMAFLGSFSEGIRKGWKFSSLLYQLLAAVASAAV